MHNFLYEIPTLFCLFVVYRPTREFCTHMEALPLPVKGCKFWPMLSTYGHEQWGIFSVPHLMWPGASIYNGHLRGPVTLTPYAEQWSCHYFFLRLRSVASGIRTPNLPLAGPTLWPTVPPPGSRAIIITLAFKMKQDAVCLKDCLNLIFHKHNDRLSLFQSLSRGFLGRRRFYVDFITSTRYE